MDHPHSETLQAAQERLERLVDWERRKRAAMRVTTEPERRLLEKLGRPEVGLKVVHVTGSKGKGSTSSLIATALGRAGLSVGRYGSPHVERLNERFVIAGREIEDEPLGRVLTRALDARDELVREDPSVEPTWFDVVTAAALCAFRDAGVEWLVAEVGLGGRLDSTNVLVGTVCVITNVELEHTSVLGTTRAAIAWEKAGILKPGCTLVTAIAEADEAGRVIAERARELGVTVLRPPWAGALAPRSIAERNRDLAELALAALAARGVRAAHGGELATRIGTAELAAARLPARLERFVVGGVTVVLDGAHTPLSVAAVVGELSADPTLRGRPSAVLGLARDKDLDGVLKVLGPAAEKVFCTSVGTDLHRTPGELAAAAGGVGVVAESVTPPRTALELALEHARTRGSWVLVVGSLYLAGALRTHLRQAVP